MLNSGSTIVDFIKKFKILWVWLFTLNANVTPGSFKAIFKELFNCEVVKRLYLLVAVVKHHSNIVSNFSNRPDFFYNDLKERFLILPIDYKGKNSKNRVNVENLAVTPHKL